MVRADRQRSLGVTAAAAMLLAAAYSATGLLGMQLAAAPGNVTPVWLPAGLALAALLSGKVEPRDNTVVILSGGNIDAGQFSAIIAR